MASVDQLLKAAYDNNMQAISTLLSAPVIASMTEKRLNKLLTAPLVKPTADTPRVIMALFTMVNNNSSLDMRPFLEQVNKAGSYFNEIMQILDIKPNIFFPALTLIKNDYLHARARYLLVSNLYRQNFRSDYMRRYLPECALDWTIFDGGPSANLFIHYLKNIIKATELLDLYHAGYNFNQWIIPVDQPILLGNFLLGQDEQPAIVEIYKRLIINGAFYKPYSNNPVYAATIKEYNRVHALTMQQLLREPATPTSTAELRRRMNDKGIQRQTRACAKLIEQHPALADRIMKEIIREHSVVKCANETTLDGLDTVALHENAVFKYTVPGTEIVYCFDILDAPFLLKTGKNPYTNEYFSSNFLNDVYTRAKKRVPFIHGFFDSDEIAIANPVKEITGKFIQLMTRENSYMDYNKWINDYSDRALASTIVSLTPFVDYPEVSVEQVQKTRRLNRVLIAFETDVSTFTMAELVTRIYLDLEH